MNRLAAAGAAGILVAIALDGAETLALDNFQKLKGSQIQTRFAGMEMTDEVHWGDVYGRDGTLTTYEMGSMRVGKWWVQKDELCHDRGKELKACYEVWISGKKVELRRAGSAMPFDGVLQKPADRK
jgi:hypothetical protein